MPLKLTMSQVEEGDFVSEREVSLTFKDGTSWHDLVIELVHALPAIGYVIDPIDDAEKLEGYFAEREEEAEEWISQYFKQKQKEEAEAFDDERINVIGQNGNTGEHYKLDPKDFGPAEAFSCEEADEWIPWHGGENPVPGKKVLLGFRYTLTHYPELSDYFYWTHNNMPDSAKILAYKVVE